MYLYKQLSTVEEVRHCYMQESSCHMIKKYIERCFLEVRFCAFMCYLFERLSS